MGFRLILISSLHLASLWDPRLSSVPTADSRPPLANLFLPSAFFSADDAISNETTVVHRMHSPEARSFSSQPENVKAKTPRGADFCAGFIAARRRRYIITRGRNVLGHCDIWFSRTRAGGKLVT